MDIEKLQAIYLNYLNNYLTLATFADHYHLPTESAKHLIEAGKIAHEFIVELHKKG